MGLTQGYIAQSLMRDDSQKIPTVDAGPAYFRPAVTPTIGGTLTPVVAISSGAAAGSKHINDATPTAAETLVEQVHWVFDSAASVKKIQVGLNTPTLGSTCPEAAYLKVTVNPGDDVTAATRLANGYPEVHFVYPGETLELQTDAAVTDVYAIAALTAVATPLVGGSTMDCKGVSYV